MIRTPNELLEDIKARIGDDTSDEALTLLENVNDTINDLNNKATDTTNWKAKFEENDANWRQKYRDRFFNSEAEEPDEPDDERRTTMINFDELFKEG